MFPALPLFIVRRTVPLLCTFWLALVVSVQAQTGPAAPTYYVGAAWLYNNAYEVLYAHTPNLGGVGPWQVAMGGHWNPRFSAQIGYAYAHDRENVDPLYAGTDTTGAPVSGTLRSSKVAHAVPMLLRYAVLHPQASPVRFRALLGATLLRTSAELYLSETVNGQLASEFYDKEKAWQLYATGGLEVGYQFGQHVEVAATLTWSKNVKPASEYVHRMTTGNAQGITSALALGLRYGFNFAKPASASAAR